MKKTKENKKTNGTIEVAKGSFWKNKTSKQRLKVIGANEFELTVELSTGSNCITRTVEQLFNGFKPVSVPPGAEIYLFTSDNFSDAFIKKYGV